MDGLDLDSYENLILLCKVHHKLVDDQPSLYTIEKLTGLKRHHETWVRESLAKDALLYEATRMRSLARIRGGKDVVEILDAEAFVFDHDELETDYESKLVSSFLQSLEDWGNLWSDLESGQRSEVRFALAKDVKELESAGFCVFGLTEYRNQRAGDVVVKLTISIVTVVRSSNPAITDAGYLAAIIKH